MNMYMIAVCLIFSPSWIYAQESQATQNGITSMLPLVLIFVIFYFLLIRPQQKKTKEHKILLNTLKKDDKIIASGGIYATVVAVKGDIVEVKIADGVKIQIKKSSVSTILGPSDKTTTPEVAKN